MNNPYKLIHIITGLDLGGAEQMLKRLLLSDSESKDKVLIISLTGMGQIGEALHALGYQIQTLNFQNLSSIPSNFLTLVTLIKRNKPELVQTWMYHADFFGGLAARIAGCSNVIWGIRNTFVPANNKQTYCLMRLCALLSYLIPKKIICVAEAAKNKHIAYGYAAKKMHVIPNGFDFTHFDAQGVDNKCVRNELGISSSDLVVGCVGRWHLDKGQDIFIKAIALMKQKNNQPIHFILIGRGCDQQNQVLQNEITSLGLSTSVILLGERYDIPECLAAMDVFCMPSRTEGFPNGLGEAMSMGLACLATRVGDTQILTADTVVLVAPNDPMALATELSLLIDMPPDLRQLLGQKAAKRVRTLFSIDKARARFYTLYRAVVESSH